ncbi:unnamed protein product [Penicillium glandicola]
MNDAKIATKEQIEPVDQNANTNGFYSQWREKVLGPWASVCVVVALVIAMLLNIVATAIPQITDEFHSLDQVGWYGSAFFVGLVAFQAVWGKIYRFFPLKATFMVAIVLFETGSLICAVSQNSITLIAGRAITGAGGSGVTSGCYIIIAHIAAPEKRAAYTGILGATYGIASIMGPLVGGAFTDQLTWRWCFWINLPIGFAAVILLLLTFSTPASAKPIKSTWIEILRHVDLLSVVIIIASFVCYLLAMQWGGVSKSWDSADVIGTIVGWIVLLVVFAALQWFQGEYALIVPRLVQNKVIAVCAAFNALLAGAYFIIVYYMPIYFQTIGSSSALRSGIQSLPLILSASVFSLTGGVVLAAFGHFQYHLIIGSTLLTIGCGLLYTLQITLSTGAYVGYQLLAGVGVGIAMQVPVVAAQGLVEMKDISSVTSILLFFQTMGGAYFISAGESAFTNRMISTISKIAPDLNSAKVVSVGATEIHKIYSGPALTAVLEAYMSGFRTAWILCIAAAGLAFVISLVPLFVRVNGKIQSDQEDQSQSHLTQISV